MRYPAEDPALLDAFRSEVLSPFDTPTWKPYNPAMTWSARRIRTMVVLLLLLAFSLAAAWGRKTPKEEVVKVTLRRISPGEAMAILQQFPELVPSYVASFRNDTHDMYEIYGFIEATAAPLTRIFPATRFYASHDFYSTPHPYFMAIAGGKRYPMPDYFNLLLHDNRLKVTDRNVLALAKALALVAVEDAYGPYPQVSFMDAHRTKLDRERLTDAATLKVKIGAQIEEWHFYVWRNQFEGASAVTEKGLVKDYHVSHDQRPLKR